MEKSNSATAQQSDHSGNDAKKALMPYEAFLAEVARLLREKDLGDAWVRELMEADAPFLEKEYAKGRDPVYAAYEIYLTETDANRVPDDDAQAISLALPDKTKAYLQQLVEVGLWGDSVEAVALALMQQQLAAKLEAGVVKIPRI